jgi:head-tail adaptor
MQAGEFMTKITLQKRQPGSGVYAQPTYCDIMTVYSKWKDLNSVEMLKNESLQGYRYATVVIHQTQIDGTYRIIKDGEAWDMLGYPKELEPGFIEFKVQKAVAG